MKTLFFLLATSLPIVLAADNYSIDTYKIAGGGGISSGGGFVLAGTIGQADAGTLTGGAYTLEGGFMSGVYVVQTLGSPALSIRKSGTTSTISWTIPEGGGFVLEERPNLSPTSVWAASAAAQTTNGNSVSIVVPSNSGLRFFRLRK